VLNEKPVAGHAEARGWAAEGLPKRVGVTAREVGQARKNVDSSKSVGHWGVEGHAVDRQSRFDQVDPSGYRETVAHLVMVLAAPAVALVGTAEADEAADINSRARLVVGAQRDPACRKLEAEIVHCPGARDRRKRARQPLVFRKG